MSKIINEEGRRIEVNKPVKQLLFDGKKTKGVQLENGEKVYADEVIINADFSYSMTNLIPKNKLKKYSEIKLKKKKYSCATFMNLYQV